MGIERSSSPGNTDDARALGVHVRPPIGRVAVLTDSVAQVPQDLAERWRITVVPLAVSIGSERYYDGVDLTPSELYRRMRVEKVVPTTSAPSIGQYLEAYRGCLGAGAEAVLHVSLSSNLSMAYTTSLQAAELARAEHPDRVIEVLDSRQGAIPEGFIALEAARAAADGLPLQEVIQRARAARSRTGILVSLATLEYLARGGRIGKAAYWASNLINVKPLITLDEEGIAAPVSRVRGAERALQAMVDWAGIRVAGHPEFTLAIVDADAPEAVAQLRDLLLRRLQPVEILYSDFTPVMGVHTGPGLVGVAYYYEP